MPLHNPVSRRETAVIRVCSAQIASTWEDPEKTLDRVEQFVRHAAWCGADIICFPEQFATGWDPESLRHVQQQTGQIVTALKSFAADSGIAILGSFREASAQGPRNTAVVIGKDGAILTLYSKIHLFSPAHENDFFHPGSDLAMFSCGSLCCGVAICYDLRFPDLFRIYAQKGVHVVFVPAAWPENRNHLWELFIRARAAENQMYIVGVNTTGKTPVDQYSGGSLTADPWGTIIQKAGDAEQLLFSDIDLRIIEDIRTSFPIARDRKEAVYQSLARDISDCD